jgi:predicted ribosome quality control (RQC) complex YloA/Tae2 family protein
MKPTPSFDALTLHAVADELRARILGARVQKVALLGPGEIGLELYGRERASVLISTDARAARVVLTPERPVRTSDAVTPLLLLLRKYVRDGRVKSVDQPRLERVLELRVSKRDDGELRESRLIIEVMGRRSNAVLVTDDGTILDALRRAGHARNPARPVLPHLRYQLPPPQARLDPTAADTWDMMPTPVQAARKRPLADTLASTLTGFSPLLAREAAFRAAGRLDALTEDAEWQVVRRVVGELLRPIGGGVPWSPSIARADGLVVASAPYRLSHLETTCSVEDVESISAAVELGFGETAAGGNSRGSRPAGDPVARPLIEAIDARAALVSRRRAALERSLTAAGDPTELRTAGELILGLAHGIEPGQESLVVDERTIRLDPDATPVENAQRYFLEYRRARDATRRVPALIERATLELAHLDEMRTLVELADDPGRLRALRDELRSGNILAGPAPRPARGRPPGEDGARPLRVPLPNGFNALVGTSARGNERVTFDQAGQDDVWLHARQLPGAHVVVRTGGRDLPPEVLRAAAELAAHFSRGRESGRVPVDWTLRKHVRKIRGGPPGLVSYVNERTLDVEPRGPSGG